MTDTIPHIRTSERRSFKRCQQQWQWAWRQGLKSRSNKPDALWFGTGIHLALQHRYSLPGVERGHDVLKVWRDYVGDDIAAVRIAAPGEYDSEESAWVDAGELGEIMLGAYLDKYGRDEQWHVISAEQTFEIPILRPNTVNVPHSKVSVPDSTLCYYNGTFDLVALDLADDSSLWLWDHKTARAIRTGHLSLDDQAGSYWAVAGDVLAAQGLIQPGMKLEGILYNFLRKGKPDERPTNALGQALNKPGKSDYIKALVMADMQSKVELKISLDANGDFASKLTIPKLAEYCEGWGISVYGEVSKVQPSALFLREPVYRTASERRRQIQKIQDEALQMEALRGPNRLLPITKNPTMDCEHGCAFFSMCEMHENGDDWQEFKELAFKRVDPYADHHKSADTGE